MVSISSSKYILYVDAVEVVNTNSKWESNADGKQLNPTSINLLLLLMIIKSFRFTETPLNWDEYASYELLIPYNFTLQKQSFESNSRSVICTNKVQRTVVLYVDPVEV